MSAAEPTRFHHLSPAEMRDWSRYKQKGGKWYDFLKKLGRSAIQFVKNKPITTAAMGAKFLPGGQYLAPVLGTIGTMTGKGKKRKTKKKQSGGKKVSQKGVSMKGL